MLTKKHVRDLKSFRVRRDYVGPTNAEIKKDIEIAIVAAIGEEALTELKESDTQFSFRNRCWMKNKIADTIEGRVEIKSKKYVFYADGSTTGSHGNIVDMEMTEDGWELDMFCPGRLKYTIL